MRRGEAARFVRSRAGPKRCRLSAAGHLFEEDSGRGLPSAPVRLQPPLSSVQVPRCVSDVVPRWMARYCPAGLLFLIVS